MLKALVFDLGGTLLDIVHKDEYKLPCGSKILDYLARHDIHLPLDSKNLMIKIEKQKKLCWEIRTATCREISPFELWSEWYLKGIDLDRDKLRVIADNLTDVWERHYYHMELRPEAPAMLKALGDMGIVMGLISNTVCFYQAIENLYTFGLRHYFKSVYLSSVSGFIKPHRDLFLAAAGDLCVRPDECVYVGDTVSRDVMGARNAGYRASIRIGSYLTGISDTNDDKDDAEYIINTLNEIPGIVRGLLYAENR